MALNLHVPQQPDEFRPRIYVIGVGGAGGNAINNMIASGLEGVEFLVCNTDAQDLSQSLCDNRLQLGPTVTKGLGAGMKPEVGAQAADESMEEILHRLDGANMVFITAGMGGGTGTGAAPVIAKALRERDVLTVGVVTKPFQFEGMKRSTFAEEGIAKLSESVDTLIVIPNQNLFRMANEKTTFADAFKMADNVLLDGVRGVSDLIVKPGIVNLDFADVRTLMTVMGKAMMGTGEGEGETRALDAAERAIANPLLDDMSLDGAQGVLINVTGGYDVTLYEVDAVANHVREKVDPEANIIFGSSVDESMTGGIRVSVVATGIDADKMPHRTMPPQGGPGSTPPGGPGGPGGHGGPSGPGGGIPSAAPAQPQTQNSPPMSPFGRSPFAYRSGGDQGPSSSGFGAAEMTAQPQTTQVAPAQQAQTTPPPLEQVPQAEGLQVSPNYAPVPPANQDAQPQEVGFAARVGQTSGEFSAPQTAENQEPDLFAGSTPQPSVDAQKEPASSARLGGLFSRFASPKKETIPQTETPTQTPRASHTGGTVSAAAPSPFAGVSVQSTAPQQVAQAHFEPEQAPVLDLDAGEAQTFVAPAPMAEPTQVESGPKVVDLDDSGSNGLNTFDESYKSVPAFLRHQNN